MGKRKIDKTLKKKPQDTYHTTDPRAVEALLPFLLREGIWTFAEPCAGDLHLVNALIAEGFKCGMTNDIAWTPGADALDIHDFGDVDAIITNPPWTPAVLHAMIGHFCTIKPTWLLFNSDWAYNLGAVPYLPFCTDIVAVGRIKWFPGSDHQGKDNTSWYRFDSRNEGPTVFHNRRTPRRPARGSLEGSHG